MCEECNENDYAQEEHEMTITVFGEDQGLQNHCTDVLFYFVMMYPFFLEYKYIINEMRVVSHHKYHNNISPYKTTFH